MQRCSRKLQQDHDEQHQSSNATTRNYINEHRERNYKFGPSWEKAIIIGITGITASQYIIRREVRSKKAKTVNMQKLKPRHWEMETDHPTKIQMNQHVTQKEEEFQTKKGWRTRTTTPTRMTMTTRPQKNNCIRKKHMLKTSRNKKRKKMEKNMNRKKTSKNLKRSQKETRTSKPPRQERKIKKQKTMKRGTT
jgi:hypothetical protein